MDSNIILKNKKEISKNAEMQTYFKNIKSKIILKQIFGNLHQKKLFEIIKYNKNMQKSLDKSIDDYKNLYKSIEIEIIPANNKYGSFINILNKEEKSFYHIYFNDDKKEINRLNITKDDYISKIRVIIDYPVKNFNDLFKKF